MSETELAEAWEEISPEAKATKPAILDHGKCSVTSMCFSPNGGTTRFRRWRRSLSCLTEREEMSAYGTNASIGSLCTRSTTSAKEAP